jgi:acyl carrier protein
VNSSDPGASRSLTLERIERVVCGLLGTDDISLTPETRPSDVEGWDSLANINIVFGVEEEFGIQFRDDDLANATTVGELALRVDRLLAQ